MNEEGMRKLLELGALIEQLAIKSEIHQEIALASLEGIREMVLRDHVPPSVEPQAEIQARPASQIPIPQIWLQSEPITEQEAFPEPPHACRTSVPEPVCFDELDPNQLAQVNTIPFLFHNGWNNDIFG